MKVLQAVSLELLDRKTYMPDKKKFLACQSPEMATGDHPLFKPSLIMLDIEIPNMNGFDLLSRISDWDFDVIFTTAYDKYAILRHPFQRTRLPAQAHRLLDLQNAINRHIIRRNLYPQEQRKARQQPDR